MTFSDGAAQQVIPPDPRQLAFHQRCAASWVVSFAWRGRVMPGVRRLRLSSGTCYEVKQSNTSAVSDCLDISELYLSWTSPPQQDSEAESEKP